MQHEMMNTSRREFLKGGVAFGGLVAASALRVFADEANGRRLRIGILSDTHLDGGAVAAQKLERALLAFRRGRVDGVLICGDLADNGVVPQLEELARTWDKVFPGSKGTDGSHVERLFHYGDHDNRGRWMSGEAERVRKQYGWTEGELAENACFLHPKEHWERIFGEPWSQIVHKRVKGYDFVLAHFNPHGRNTTPGLKQFLEGMPIDPAKPFFYSQHRVLRNTVCGPGVWGQDDGTVGRLLSAYPNCCAFCGHSHQTAVREDSIWQGAFTAVQVPSLKYVTQEDGHANRLDGREAEQGMVMDVHDDRIVLHRLDFASKARLAPSWIVPLVGGTRPFARETRRCAAKAPEFPAGAILGARIDETKDSGGNVHRTLSLDFPIVNGQDGGVRAYDYKVSVFALCFGGDVVRDERYYFSPKCHFAPSADTGTMQVSFSLDGFKKWNSLQSRSYGALHVEVRPREIFGGLGHAIEADAQ